MIRRTKKYVVVLIVFVALYFEVRNKQFGDGSISMFYIIRLVIIVFCFIFMVIIDLINDSKSYPLGEIKRDKESECTDFDSDSSNYEDDKLFIHLHGNRQYEDERRKISSYKFIIKRKRGK